VVAGDFDPAAMEAKIRARFADWKAVGPAGTEPDLGPIAPRQAEGKVMVNPGVQLNLQVAWVRPPDLAPDTLAKRRADMIEQLGFNVLNRRLSAIARGTSPPFLGAVAYKADQGHSAEITAMNLLSTPDGWREALAALDVEQRRAVQYGVRQDELDREIAEARAQAQAAAAGAATRRPVQIADEIVGSLGDQQVVTNPAQDLELFEATVKGLKADKVSDALRAAFKGQGPLLFMTSPKAVPGGEPQLIAEYQQDLKLAVTAPVAPREAVWPYQTFGEPGKVAETRKSPTSTPSSSVSPTACA
jgi:zinc protease